MKKSLLLLIAVLYFTACNSPKIDTSLIYKVLEISSDGCCQVTVRTSLPTTLNNPYRNVFTAKPEEVNVGDGVMVDSVGHVLKICKSQF